MEVFTACSKLSVFIILSKSENFVRLREARLHAESSKNMYSEQGLLALILPEFGQVFHLFIIVSYCKAGSPVTAAALATLSKTSPASTIFLLLVNLFINLLSGRYLSSLYFSKGISTSWSALFLVINPKLQSSPFKAAFINSSV